MLNNSLAKLKNIFDRIESYDPAKNTGFRSLKNIGVWLCVYALTDDKDQIAVINELAKNAAIVNQNDISNIKTFVDSLVQPDVLKTIIEDYEKANGTFALTVRNEKSRQMLEDKINQRHLQNILLNHVTVDPQQDPEIAFLMKNSIKFNWAAHGSDLSSAIYSQSKDNFCGQEIDYLKADSEEHDVHYGLVKHKNSLYHVVQLGTLQKNDNETIQRTNAYIIEPVNNADAANLQNDYFDIIDSIKKNGFDDGNTYKLLKDKTSGIHNVAVQGKLTKDSEFNFLVNFPKLAGPMKTTEQRLGIYAQFANKVIANINASNIYYKGIRELVYDEKGGEIKNREEFGATESFVLRPSSFITVNYKVANPFMMIYEGVNGADYYPYFIANPRMNLEMEFSAQDQYPPSITQRINKMSSHSCCQPL